MIIHYILSRRVNSPEYSAKAHKKCIQECSESSQLLEHDIVDYYRVLKGKEYHSGMQK